LRRSPARVEGDLPERVTEDVPHDVRLPGRLVEEDRQVVEHLRHGLGRPWVAGESRDGNRP
jgi:hypothetical protein